MKPDVEEQQIGPARLDLVQGRVAVAGGAGGIAFILEQAVKEGDLSRAGIQKAMVDVGTLTFDGLTGDYKYGPPANREPPRTTTIFRINPAKPIGLEVAKPSFESDAARQYTIPTG